VEPAEWEDGSVHRRPPAEMPVRKAHREKALPIGLKESAGLQIGPYRHYVAVVRAGVRQLEPGRDRLYRHAPIVSERGDRCP
jgi:hypothetical protein